jgi:hypothetical protein
MHGVISSKGSGQRRIASHKKYDFWNYDSTLFHFGCWTYLHLYFGAVDNLIYFWNNYDILGGTSVFIACLVWVVGCACIYDDKMAWHAYLNYGETREYWKLNK